jgi:EmrB/QacA subfamily drug resistance transporter
MSRAARSPLVLPLIIACALFMENMDGTIIATSLPAIARDLQQDPVSLKLALTSYYVSLAVFIPASGWVADRFGARSVFCTAIAVFVAGSVACGYSDSLVGFVVARFLQGIGGAMMVPVGRLVLLKTVDKKDLVKALSYLTFPALIGPVIGPPLGGFITTYWHWRWIFFLNVPIGFIGVALALKFVPQIREDDPGRFDPVGFVLSGAGLALLMLGLATAGQHLLSLTSSIVCAIIGVAVIAGYFWHAGRIERPVLDFRFVRQVRTYRTGILSASLFRIGVGATPFLLPLMLQVGFGMTPLQSGLMTCMTALAAMFMKTLASRFLRAFGFRSVLMWNGLVASSTIAAYGLFTPLTPHLVMLVVLFFGGFSRSLQFTATNALQYADIEKRNMGPASGVVNVAQQLSLSIGVTIGAYSLMVANRLSGHATLEPSDFSLAFVVVGLIGATSFFSNRRLPLNAGDEVSGRNVVAVTTDPVGAQGIQQEPVK